MNEQKDSATETPVISNEDKVKELEEEISDLMREVLKRDQQLAQLNFTYNSLRSAIAKLCRD